jgi:hypothetical protein
MSNHTAGLSLIDTGHGDMVALVNTDQDGQSWFNVMSASGPVSDSWTVVGPITVGMTLSLRYNYDTDAYMVPDTVWKCEVVRINRKTLTVKSAETGNLSKLPFA